MNNNITVNLTLNNNYVWQNHDTIRYNRPPKEVVTTQIVAILSTDSVEMIDFKWYMNQSFPGYVERTLGKPNQQSTACPVCDVRLSPEWRSGPNRQKVCNACGIQFARFKKQMLEQQERTKAKMSLSYILN